MSCPVCESPETTAWSCGKKAREYAFCRSCGSVSLSPVCFLPPEAQLARYQRHHNSLSDTGYREFLADFLTPVLEAFHSLTGAYPLSVLDYGCGPAPCLLELLEEFSRDGFFGESPPLCTGWDPFFRPQLPPDGYAADLVTCLEVAEHFETPRADFRRLAGFVRPGGLAAVGTMLLPPGGRAAFENWWYRSDGTHVTFYTLEGLCRALGAAGLEFQEALSERVFLFKKTPRQAESV